jgi:hypothetical protein
MELHRILQELFFRPAFNIDVPPRVGRQSLVCDTGLRIIKGRPNRDTPYSLHSTNTGGRFLMNMKDNGRIFLLANISLS